MWISAGFLWRGLARETPIFIFIGSGRSLHFCEQRYSTDAILQGYNSALHCTRYTAIMLHCTQYIARSPLHALQCTRYSAATLQCTRYAARAALPLALRCSTRYTAARATLHALRCSTRYAAARATLQLALPCGAGAARIVRGRAERAG